MDVTATLTAPCSPEDLFVWVDELDRYLLWLDIVRRAEPELEPGEPAWTVDLGGKLGPFARSKRLRMVRTVHDIPSEVRFERREKDGRSHSPWVLAASVRPVDDGSELTMRLHYGGGLWGPVLERMLRDEIEKSKPRLLALVESG